MAPDSLKYFDSIIVLKKEIITAQDTAVSTKMALLDSLDKSIVVRYNLIQADRSYSEIFRSFAHDLKKLMISEEIAVFVIGCSIMGLIIITADWVTFAASKGDAKKSMFGLKYSGRKKVFFNYVLWGIGSGLLAYIATSLEMFKCSIQSCVVIAVTWPALLPKIIKKLHEEEEQELEDIEQQGM